MEVLASPGSDTLLLWDTGIDFQPQVTHFSRFDPKFLYSLATELNLANTELQGAANRNP
jgi:hypothetical protein